MLDMRRLAIFHEVAEIGSFSAAALSLAYTQSVVSHHVARLEDELGVTLFERGKRPVRLTPAGERLHAHSSSILGAVRLAETEMRAVAGLETGELRVGAFLSACASFVPAALGAFADAHPDVEARLDQLEPPASIPKLIAGEIDLAVVWRFFGEEDDPDPRLERAHLLDDPYRMVLPPTHRLARRREVGLDQMAGERFTGPRPVGGAVKYHQMLQRLCDPAGFEPDMTHYVDDIAVARSFIAAGLAVGLMPELSVPPPRPDVAVKPLRGVEPFRAISAVWMKGRRAPGLAPMVAALKTAARSAIPGR